MQKLEKIDHVLSGTQESKVAILQPAVVNAVNATSVSQNTTDKLAPVEGIVINGKSTAAESLVVKDGHYDLPFKFTGVFDSDGFHGTMVPA